MPLKREGGAFTNTIETNILTLGEGIVDGVGTPPRHPYYIYFYLESSNNVPIVFQIHSQTVTRILAASITINLR